MEILVRISYFIIPMISLIIAAVNHFFTSYGMRWYKSMVLPSFALPHWFMEIVWQLIYLFTTIVVLVMWNRFGKDLRSILIMVLFVVNAFLAVYWRYLFFYQHKLDMGLIVSLILLLTIVLLLFLLWPLSRLLSILLMPYVIWELFIIILLGTIWYLN